MLTEQKIRTFVGEQNFLKGQQGVRNGAIVHPEQQAMTLKAYCYGSLPEPYRVQVTFDGTGITTALCSCSGGTPAYGNRRCEHTAALLLAWKAQPEAFTQTDDIDTILQRQSKAQLITLIKKKNTWWHNGFALHLPSFRKRSRKAIGVLSIMVACC